MKVVAIVQARLGSTRLPAKVLLDLGGATALQRCLDRVARFSGVDEVIVATTTMPEDDLIEHATSRMKLRCVRGSAEDVLSRYRDAARLGRADVVVRCTSDCPFLDPALSSELIRSFLQAQNGTEPLDYAANNLERRLPRGLDTEIFTRDALERAAKESTSAAEHEHVTPYIYRHPEIFRIRAVLPTFSEDLSSHRWTLDTLSDYRLLATLYHLLGDRAPTASLGDILEVFARRPDLKQINADIVQKPVDL